MIQRKVLVSAYACEPGRGSEPGVGWNWVQQIARFAEVWVITRANNREVIEQALAQDPMPNVHWVYYDLPRWARFWKRRQSGVHLYYYLWQIGIYLLAKRLHKEVRFDLVHHVTFVSYWMPSFLSLLPAPFVWGPVGGGDSTPASFYRTLSHQGQVYEYSRGGAIWLGENDPFVRKTARKSSIALATTVETAKRLEKLGCRDVRILSQVALPEEEIRQLAELPFHREAPFRFVSVGRLLHLKGFHLGLKAFAKLLAAQPQSEYWFIGDGPERKNLERLASELGIQEKIRFFGTLPRPEVLSKLAECNALVHPSLHDSGGWSIVEALAAGRPVLCLDHGGPGTQVTSETGFKIPPHAPDQVIEDTSRAMIELARTPHLAEGMGAAARQRVASQFTWQAKGRQIEQFYLETYGKQQR